MARVHVQVAFVLSCLGPPWCPRGSSYCFLGRSAAVCLVARLCLVEVDEVFAVVPLGASCFLPGPKILCDPLERWGADRLFAAFGCNWPPRHPRTIRVMEVCSLSCRVQGYFVARWKFGAQAVCSPGGREPLAWLQMKSSRNRHFVVFSK